MMQQMREWLWTAGLVVVLLFRMLSGWIRGMFNRRNADLVCDVLEIDDVAVGREKWDIPEDDETPRRYFHIESTAATEEEVRQCAHRNGLPQEDDQHPTKAVTVREVTLRRDEIENVWQAMVIYQNELTNKEVLQLYAENEEEIAAIWKELGGEASMRDAVEEWLRRKK